MDTPRTARGLSPRVVGGLASGGAVGAFCLMAIASALPVLASCASLKLATLPYTGTTQTASAAPGSSVYDTVQVKSAGNKAIPAGTFTFSLYPTSSCSGTPVFQSPVAYAGTTSSSSTWISSGTYLLPSTIATPATYEWTVSFVESGTSGSGSKASSGCGQESVKICNALIAPGLTTLPTPATGSIGTVLSDTAQVTGAAAPASSDTVTFALYLASAAQPTSCTAGTLVDDFGASPLTGSGSPWSSTSSGGFAPTVAGTYLWQVQFVASNDVNYQSSQVFCGEAVTIAASGGQQGAGTGGQQGSGTGGGQQAAGSGGGQQGTGIGGQLAASTTTPDTGFGGGGLALLGAVAVVLGGLAIGAGVRLSRITA